ncbi:hypothetical protein GCK72_007681 [Caenorhabditis remanei]|uniref:C2H2-type domain-containing protein n=1 Tax=Caenorhabditis remanei TaxID=31234 RepID=A0A6A5HPI2_CAERE|nr:hypothetical protein GCK72_007681 [Caenorhabditis remanei]KAF1767722.1 hypothetical protein GCK72_007681 [Caenorhabditis remanei]
MADTTKPYQCTVCHKTFAHHCFLKRHEVVHTGEKPFECDVCGFRFSQKAHLSTHLRTIHAEQTPKSSRNTPRNLGRKARKSAKAVNNKNRTASTPKTNKNQSIKAPKRYRQEVEDLEAMDDDNDRSEQQREIDLNSVVSSNRDTGNHGNSDEVL